MQSYYKKHDSTETAPANILDDILISVDQHMCVVLLLLDLSTAFDTIDHSIPPSNLKCRYGIDDQLYQWIASCFQNRRQSVLTDGHKSKKHVLKCNVPQGSVLRPKFFVDYESTLTTSSNYIA